MMRVGQGYDSHRFVEGRPLILGGVVIPHPLGLAGHSDADPVAHALIDALLGAAALGDIGQAFPDTDPTWHNADSMDLLTRTMTRLQQAGYRFHQADVTVVTQAPRLGPHIPAMRERLASVIGTTVDQVSVKAKTNEMMGFIGRGEGIAVLAVATIHPE